MWQQGSNGVFHDHEDCSFVCRPEEDYFYHEGRIGDTEYKDYSWTCPFKLNDAEVDIHGFHSLDVFISSTEFPVI